ncbi:efflux RND transporter periplasmic adaptor subunit [Leptothoe spongobia]|uniref:Efflux RND transporter periplasmic adaptor subunit n=1 Tax=Leptothoe spongobia TAU-MAC 1115 TaxID=1967444 RepID=A0A947DI85_9CYAN|nr:efflux RND transporter periplasmic adaptor subunit [Leptothoe spongobia]MBT9317133.1 efflux RND transporter periplasmic adaptor subunit [Leptothoe spongobia TAU-MAC 1115]
MSSPPESTELQGLEENLPIENPPDPSIPWWRKSGKALLGLGVFALLSTGIVGATHMLTSGMEGHDMGGHGGHDMSGHDMGGMSHDEMMRVDGAFNPTPVTVEVVKSAPLDASVNYTGAILPYTEVTVYPRVAGQLSNYDIYPGDWVDAGQLLANLDAIERVSQTSEAQASATALLATAEASQFELEEQQQEIIQIQADLDYLILARDRFETLTAKGATSQSQYDLAASQVDAKRAMLDGAKAKLIRLQSKVTSDQAQVERARAQINTASAFEGYTQISAPISGIVQARMADPGVVVQPGMGIFKIGDYQQVRLQANVAQQDANQIRVGTPIVAKIQGTDAGVIQGEITSIFPQADLETRTVTVEAVVDNPERQLLSGQFVDMEIITQRRTEALSVPQKAVVSFNGEAAIWVVNGSNAQRRRVTTGMMSRDRIEIIDGLKVGDQVITSGHSRLIEGGAVTVVDALGNPTDDFVSTADSALELSLVSPDTVKAGKNEITFILKNTETGERVTVSADDLALDITMPMKNMAPMMAKVELSSTDNPGEFKVNTHLGMKGDWIIEATVTDAEQAGKARLTVPVN